MVTYRGSLRFDPTKASAWALIIGRFCVDACISIEIADCFRPCGLCSESGHQGNFPNGVIWRSGGASLLADFSIIVPVRSRRFSHLPLLNRDEASITSCQSASKAQTPLAPLCRTLTLRPHDIGSISPTITTAP